MTGIDETRKNLQNRTLGTYLYEIAPKKEKNTVSAQKG